MATINLTIGSNSATVTPNSGSYDSGDQEYDITFSSTPSGVAVGDIATISDETSTSYTYKLVGISGSTYSFKYITDSSMMGTTNPYGLQEYDESFSLAQSEMTISRAYSNPNSWEAGLDDTDYYSSGDDAVGEMYDDGSATAGSPVLINGGSTVGLSSVKLTAPAGQRHDGTAGSGVKYKPSGTNTAIEIARNQVTVSWINLDCDNMSGSTPRGIVLGTGSYLGIHVHHNLVYKWEQSSGLPINGIYVYGSNDQNDTRYIHNNIVYALKDTSNDSVHGIHVHSNVHDASNPRPTYIYNNTIYNIKAQGGSKDATGILSQASGQVIKNNIAVDVDNTSGSGTSYERCFWELAGTSTWEYNLGSDTTASGLDGTNSIDSVTDYDALFVTTTAGSEDLTLESGSAAVDVGVDLSSTGIASIGIDITGATRSGSWSIGADDIVSATTTTTAAPTTTTAAPTTTTAAPTTTTVAPTTTTVAPTTTTSAPVSSNVKGKYLDSLGFGLGLDGD